MGKGRSPCCDKAGVKRGPWSEAEDLKLIAFIQKHGHSNWRALPRLAGLARCGKSCRLRWVNYLRPDLKRGNFTMAEEETIIKLHESIGNKWSKIASHFPGRTDNEIKNVWNTHLKKRLTKSGPGSSTKPASTKPKDQPPKSNQLLEASQDGENMLEVKDQGSMEEGGIKKNVSGGSAITLCDESSSLDQQSSLSSSSLISSNDMVQIDPEDFGMMGMNNYISDDAKGSVQEEVIEIPFEPNLDLWDFLDGTDHDLDSGITNNSPDYGPMNDVGLEVQRDSNSNFQQQQTSNHDQSHGSTNEWFAYLENELGLDQTQTAATTSDDLQVRFTMSGGVTSSISSSSTTTMTDQEDQELLMLINEDIEPVESYFNTWAWPSSPNCV